MNKSLVTNLLAAALVVVGYITDSAMVLSVGLFALSGAITNWVAIYMLFEKVPGLYGSGVVPSRFEEFKTGIAHLMMKQFFTTENIERFLSEKEGLSKIDLAPVIEKVDLAPSFDALISTVAQSSFGGMLSMFGGTDALLPLKEPFIVKMKASLVEMAQSDAFHERLKQEIEQPTVMADLQTKIANIVEQRLTELTPQMVKKIVQDMIQTHLGWLVIWGGVFGGLIGLVAALIQG